MVPEKIVTVLVFIQTWKKWKCETHYVIEKVSLLKWLS